MNFDFHFEIVPFQGFNFECTPSNLGGDSAVIVVDVEIGDGGFEMTALNLDWSEAQKGKLENKGGGVQLETSKSFAAINPKIREMLEKMASGVSFKKENGVQKWDGLTLAKILLTYQYNKIETSKHNWKPKKIYFFVDTSGSVWYLANLIIQLIKSTNTSKTIRVFSGSEGHPNKDENKNITLSRSRRPFLDEGLVDFFGYEKPENETTFVFWGDLQMAGIRPTQLKQLLKSYKTLWLNPSMDKNQYCESEKMAQVCNVYFGMNTTEKIITQLKKII